MYIYIYTHIMCMHAYIYIFIYISIYVCIFVCMYMIWYICNMSYMISSHLSRRPRGAGGTARGAPHDPAPPPASVMAQNDLFFFKFVGENKQNPSENERNLSVLLPGIENPKSFDLSRGRDRARSTTWSSPTTCVGTQIDLFGSDRPFWIQIIKKKQTESISFVARHNRRNLDLSRGRNQAWSTTRSNPTTCFGLVQIDLSLLLDSWKKTDGTSTAESGGVVPARQSGGAVLARQRAYLTQRIH